MMACLYLATLASLLARSHQSGTRRDGCFSAVHHWRTVVNEAKFFSLVGGETEPVASGPVNSVTRLIGGVAVGVGVWTQSAPAAAQDVNYAEIDSAVVRVLALSAPDVIEIEHRRRRYQFGIPGAGHGTGTIITRDGLVLTAAHVVSDARALAVLIPGQEKAVNARVLFTDDERDYAILQIPGEQEHVAQLCEEGSSFNVREEVFALGYPLDSARTEPQSSRGVVSGRMADGDLQLDMSLNPGNSGGPVIAKGDQVCAVVIQRSDPEKGAIGIAKAVPMKAMRAKIDEWTAKDRSADDLGEADDSVASLLSMFATTGEKWLEASLEASDSQEDQNAKVEEFARKYPNSADVQVLTSVYLWNRYMVRRAAGGDQLDLRERAVKYAEQAVKADGKLRTTSPFVEYVLDGGGRYGGGSRPRYHDGFFARVSSGIAYQSIEVPQYGGTSNWAVPVDILLGGGGRVSSGVIYRRLQGLDTGSASGAGSTFSGWGFGGFAEVHPFLDGGLDIQMRLMLTSHTYTDELTGSESNEAGFSFAAGGGYEFWIANQWAAGFNVMSAFVSLDSEWAVMPSAGLSITLH